MCKVFNIEGINITISDKALEAVKENFDWADYIVKAAAVGDYRAKEMMDMHPSTLACYVINEIASGEKDPEKLSRIAEERLYRDIGDIA